MANTLTHTYRNRTRNGQCFVPAPVMLVEKLATGKHHNDTMMNKNFISTTKTRTGLTTTTKRHSETEDEPLYEGVKQWCGLKRHDAQAPERVQPFSDSFHLGPVEFVSRRSRLLTFPVQRPEPLPSPSSKTMAQTEPFPVQHINQNVCSIRPQQS